MCNFTNSKVFVPKHTWSRVALKSTEYFALLLKWAQLKIFLPTRTYYEHITNIVLIERDCVHVKRTHAKIHNTAYEYNVCSRIVHTVIKNCRRLKYICCCDMNSSRKPEKYVLNCMCIIFILFCSQMFKIKCKISNILKATTCWYFRYDQSCWS